MIFFAFYFAFFCFFALFWGWGGVVVVVMSDLVHDVEAMHVFFLTRASLIFQKRFPDVVSS